MAVNTRDNLAAGKYENTVSPTYEKKPVTDDMTVRQAREHTERQKQLAHDQRRASRTNEARMILLLRNDLAAEHGVAEHPKEQKLWDLAWDHGHSSGFGEIITYYEEFVELLK